jgi:hypothetical protein
MTITGRHRNHHHWRQPAQKAGGHDIWWDVKVENSSRTFATRRGDMAALGSEGAARHCSYRRIVLGDVVPPSNITEGSNDVCSKKSQAKCIICLRTGHWQWSFRGPARSAGWKPWFFSKSPAGKFNDEDVRILGDTALILLNEGALGQSQDWSNPNSTARGTITVVKVFRSKEGYSCKSLRLENTVAGLHRRATFPVCEVNPGDWKIHSQAKPESNP